MASDWQEFQQRLADREQRLRDLQITQPNVPEGLPLYSPTTGQLNPNVLHTLGPDWTFLGTKTLAAAADTATIGPVPTTTKALAIVVRGGSLTAPVVSSIRGAQSKIFYWVPSVPIRGMAGLTLIPVLGLEDSTYTVNVTTGGGQTIAFYCSDFPISTLNQGPTGSQFSLPVTIATDQPKSTPWLAPLSYVAMDGPASTSVLIAAVAGSTIYLHSVQGMVDAVVAAGWWRLEDTLNSTIIWEASSAAIVPMLVDFKGVPLPSGAGLKIILSGAQVVRGTILYTQA